MPKFRFTTDDGATIIRNEEAIDLPDAKSASDEAQRGLADLAKENLPDGPQTEFRVSVENEAEEVVYHASLKFKGETGEQMRRTLLKKNDHRGH